MPPDGGLRIRNTSSAVWHAAPRIVYHGGMEDFLKSSRSMSSKDWAIDVVVALVAFAAACVQLMLTVSSIIIPDLALRQYLGLVNIVPEFGVFVALAVTTFPLAVRRAFPWPVFLFVLVVHCAFQNVYTGLALSPAGLLVALFTVCLLYTSDAADD